MPKTLLLTRLLKRFTMLLVCEVVAWYGDRRHLGSHIPLRQSA